MLRKIWRRLFDRHPTSHPVRTTKAGSVAVHRPRMASADQAFTPTQPRNARTGLIGRQHEIETIMQSLLEDKAHVVLYSDRGRGKTSLSNVIVENLKREGLMVVRYQCEADTTFDSFMRGLARRLPESILLSPARLDPLEGCEAALPAAPLRPDDVINLLSRLRLPSLVCVLDEFDRVVDPDTRTMLADTIKQLSDRGVPILFVLIGVSDSLEQLLGQHPSIQRSLVAVPLPLLADEEIAAIVDKGARETGLTFPSAFVSTVVTVSRGMPYAAHLLGLRAAQAAAKRGADVIDDADFKYALSRLIRETSSLVLRDYDELTLNGQDEAMVRALTVIATCPQDVWGRIRLIDTPGDKLMPGGQRISRITWSKLCEAGVLRRSAGDPGSTSVAHRSLVQYIQIKEASGDAPSASQDETLDADERRFAFGGNSVARLTRSP